MDIWDVLCFSSGYRAGPICFKVSTDSGNIKSVIRMDGYICFRSDVS
ncbi:hypothetical protein J2TS4_56910 [Paenibacillus sp. J2TS4]|nr:hypothetical protein J2TS4_56910 [Paenibacillus sp. J2TS4]